MTCKVLMAWHVGWVRGAEILTDRIYVHQGAVRPALSVANPR